ncbi:MAG TPA: MOSC N-terminal beta barrel domain-containing protein [Blastococcus sp.]
MRVLELWRHPVKSLQGERLDTADFGPEGITGDRQWGAVRPGHRLRADRPAGPGPALRLGPAPAGRRGGGGPARRHGHHR